jgi:hypothetical protein
MNEYPKMLYVGDGQESYTTTKVVENADEELAATSEGYANFYDLGKKPKKSKSNTVEAVDNGNNELLNVTDSNSKLAASE